MIDDSHSGTWERVGNGSYDDLSPEGLYSYSALPTVLAQQFQVKVFNGPSLADISLNSTDVLVLKTPFVPFSSEEVVAIQQFVEKGGGLLIIADHTDLLGITTNANRIIHKWGIQLNNDACNQLSDGLFTRYYPSLLAEHPIMRGIKLFSFLTSCTIQVDTVHASIVIPGLDVFSDPGDYSRPNFFGDMCPRPGQRFGSLPLCVSENVGKGRVVVFSDGTPFSNFALFFDGHIAFLRNCLDFLNSKPSHLLAIRTLLLTFCMLASAWLGFSGRKVFAHNPISRCIALIILLLGLGTGCFIGQRISGRNVDRNVTSSARSVNWINAFSNINFPAVIGLPPELYDSHSAYNSLFVSELNNESTPNFVADVRSNIPSTDCFLVPILSKEKLHDAVSWLTQCIQTPARRVVLLTDNNDIDKDLIKAVDEFYPPSKYTVPINQINGFTVRTYAIPSGANLKIIFSPKKLSDEVLGNPMDRLSEQQIEDRKNLDVIWRQFR